MRCAWPKPIVNLDDTYGPCNQPATRIRQMLAYCDYHDHLVHENRTRLIDELNQRRARNATATLPL